MFNMVPQRTQGIVHTEDEVVLRNFAVADLLRKRVLAIVDINVQTSLAQLLSDLSSVLPLS